jgi:MFS superfamily sulfate permease-like transporter
MQALWRPTVDSDLPKDFLASIVVFLTALPLCMGIALASGVPVEAGLLTGIVGGLLVGFLSGSSFQVSGPAAGLSVLVLEMVQSHGFAALGAILVVAGLIQLVGGYFRLAQLFRAVSPAVVNGMLSGIGLILISSQLYVMCDLKPIGSGWKNIAGLPAALASLPGNRGHLHAAILGVTTAIIICLWKKIAPGKLSILPPPLVAILAVSAVAELLAAPVHKVDIHANLLSSVHLVSLSAVNQLGILEFCKNALALALIASAETLLSANAVDRLHKGKRCNYDRELMAQGVGNMLCGIIGALPMTGVIARSSVNVHAGARTRRSAILHGLWLLIFVCTLPWLLSKVPVASLAALLVVTGTKLIDWRALQKLWRYGKRLIVIYLVTVIMIVCTDLLTGVMAGVLLSIAKLLYTMCRLQIKVSTRNGGRQVTLDLQGAATFISLPQLAAALERVPHNCELHVSLEHLDYLDHACLEHLMDWEQQHETSGGTLVIDWGELHAAFKYKASRRRLPARERESSLAPNVVYSLPRRLA